VLTVLKLIATAFVGAAMVLSRSATSAVTPPVFTNVLVSVTVSANSDAFTGGYWVANPPTNTLLLKVVDLDLKSAGTIAPNAPFRGATGFFLLDDRNGFAGWGPGDSNRTPPGMAFTGFGLESPGPPTCAPAGNRRVDPAGVAVPAHRRRVCLGSAERRGAAALAARSLRAEVDSFPDESSGERLILVREVCGPR
jgi:hypothetical protein